jgi:exopolyphosphatase/pppGpp-phosphohydrolase
LGNGCAHWYLKTQKSITIAVIDLGTNGFRLYIAETLEQGQYRIIHRETHELKLAAEGIHRIGDVSFQRGGYHNNHCDISKTEFDSFYQKMRGSSEKNLKKMPNVPKDKIEMLAVSLVLMNWILNTINAPKLIASANSMKAGILYEMTFEY